MGARKDIETKKMMGDRAMNDDGYTYVHGKYKGGYKKKSRNNNVVARGKRADKRGAKNKAKRRIKKEEGDSVTSD